MAIGDWMDPEPPVCFFEELISLLSLGAISEGDIRAIDEELGALLARFKAG